MSKTKQLTRHDKFHHAISEYVDAYSKNLCQLDDNYPGIEKWELENHTSSPNSSLHVYSLNIPTKYVAYTIDVRHQVDGIWYEPGPIYKKNKWIFNTISEDFDKHFNPSVQYDVFSNVKAVTSMVEIKLVNDMAIGKIHVQYHNKYPLPYPVPKKFMSLKEQHMKLIKDNDNLSEEVRELEDLYDELLDENMYMRKRNKRLFYKCKNDNSRMQKKIRELYITMNVLSDCPVCWEPIPGEKLIVPGCCHYICEGCNDKCKSCPLCREVGNQQSSSARFVDVN